MSWRRFCRPSPLLAALVFHPRPTPRAVAREAGIGWCCCHSTRVPPHEQLLMGLGGGWCVVRCRTPSPQLVVAACRCRHSNHDPPHEQLLVRLGAGGVSSVVWCWYWGLSWWLSGARSTTIHPTSSGSRGWRWLLCRSLQRVVLSRGRWKVSGDVAGLRGCGGAYLVGIPLQGSPGTPLHQHNPTKQPHIPFEWGGGGLGRPCTWRCAFFVVTCRYQ